VRPLPAPGSLLAYRRLPPYPVPLAAWRTPTSRWSDDLVRVMRDDELVLVLGAALVGTLDTRWALVLAPGGGLGYVLLKDGHWCDVADIKADDGG